MLGIVMHCVVIHYDGMRKTGRNKRSATVQRLPICKLGARNGSTLQLLLVFD